MDKREQGQAVTFFRPSWGDSQERQTSLSQGLMVADPAQSYTILRDNSCHVTFFLKEKKGGLHYNHRRWLPQKGTEKNECTN